MSDTALRGRSVLVVDDNEATTTLLSALLGKSFDVDVVSGGGDAIERLSKRSYAVVLLDVKMRGIDGYAVLDHLQKNDPQQLARVIVITGAVTERELAKVARFPLHAVVKKPFDIEQLARTVERCARPVR